MIEHRTPYKSRFDNLLLFGGFKVVTVVKKGAVGVVVATQVEKTASEGGKGKPIPCDSHRESFTCTLNVYRYDVLLAVSSRDVGGAYYEGVLSIVIIQIL